MVRPVLRRAVSRSSRRGLGPCPFNEREFRQFGFRQRLVVEFLVMKDLSGGACIERLSAFIANLKIIPLIFRRAGFAFGSLHPRNGFAELLVHGVITRFRAIGRGNHSKR